MNEQSDPGIETWRIRALAKSVSDILRDKFDAKQPAVASQKYGTEQRPSLQLKDVPPANLLPLRAIP
jgi:hypothetical protein